MGATSRLRAGAGLILFPLSLILLGILTERLGLVPGAADTARAPLASTTAVDDAEVARGLPLMSVWVSPADLHDPATGLLANVESRGRLWERPGALSYFDQGDLLFESGVGVRIHGGSSRRQSPVQSLRVYLRADYGLHALPPRLLFDGASDPIRRLVLHNDLRERRRAASTPGGERERIFWSFVNPLAYDVAARIGAHVPRTKPVRFFLNGVWQAVYVATEYVDAASNPDFFRVRWGHDRFSADLSAMQELRRWIDELPRPLTMDAVAPRVDVESLTRWFLSVLFCATRDAFQGPGQFRDDTRTDAEWFWINWDMDSSFRSPRIDSFSLLLERPGQRPRGRRPSEPRAVLMTDLLSGDPQYVTYFKAAFTRMMNHQITREFLDERLMHYDALARAYGVEDLRFLEPLADFVRNRHRLLWRLAARHLGTDQPVRVHIDASAGAVVVNGTPVRGQFDGRYFPGTRLDLAVPAAHRGDVSHWVLNGEARHHGARRITATADRDLDIQVMLR